MRKENPLWGIETPLRDNSTAVIFLVNGLPRGVVPGP
jgi:hypothetical protein